MSELNYSLYNASGFRASNVGKNLICGQNLIILFECNPKYDLRLNKSS